VVLAASVISDSPLGGVFGCGTGPTCDRTQGYLGILPQGQQNGVHLTLGTIPNPNDQLVKGVKSFDGGPASIHGIGAINPNMTNVDIAATWSNGAPLIVAGEIHGTRQVDLNFFPVSDDFDPPDDQEKWVSSTDGATIMADALLFAADAAEVPEPGTLPDLGIAVVTLGLVRRKPRVSGGTATSSLP
jgi:hypothetical protein